MKLTVFGIIAALFAINWQNTSGQEPGRDEFYYDVFPEDFLWGYATSSYQIEGGWNASGKGVNIWDNLVHSNIGAIIDGSTGDVACDSYNKFKEDVAIVKESGAQFYRFSLSWARILPDGTTGFVNPDGIRYYNDLIDELLANGIIPMVTMFHWDLPYAIVENTGYWDHPDLVNLFADYAALLYENFGDRVKHWITFNEPFVFCWFDWSYVNYDRPTSHYQCHHTVIKAHAKAYRIYEERYREQQQGIVGITLNTDWAEPTDGNNASDVAASERLMQFRYGWFAHPIVYGEYPAIMREVVDAKSEAEGRNQSRLPTFDAEWTQIVKGSTDFLGLNHYTSRLVRAGPSGEPGPDGDPDVQTFTDPEWPQGASGWLYEVPWGFRKVLKWIGMEYGNMPIYVTENGYSDSPSVGVNDATRVNYYRTYINEMLKAIRIDGVNVKGYAAWSLLDNFEWNAGYSVRFGVTYIDFNDPNRTRVPKDSARLLQQVFRDNGFPLP